MKHLAHAALPVTAAAWAAIVIITFLVNRSLESELVDLGSVD